MPCDGTLELLGIWSGNPGVGNTITLTARVNGADSALTAQITNGNSSAYDSTHQVSVVAGDRIAFKCATSASLGGDFYIIHIAAIITTASSTSMVCGYSGGNNTLTSGTNYWALQNVYGSSTTEADVSQVMPTAGNFTKIYVYHDTPPGAGTSYTYTLRVNGVDSILTVNLADANNAANDTHTVAVVAGDLVSLKQTVTGAVVASKLKFGLKFAPTIDGEAVILGVTVNNFSTSDTENMGIVGGQSPNYINTGEYYASGVFLTDAFTVQKLYLVDTVAPGVGKSWNYYFLNNYAVSTLTAPIADAATTGNNTASSVVAAVSTYIGFVAKPTGSPAATKTKWGLVFYQAPAGAGSTGVDRMFGVF